MTSERKPWLAIALACLCALQAPSAVAAPADAEVATPAFTQRTLANGLRVFATRDTSTPNVSVQVWYQVGGKDDPKGRLGFAHLFEHLTFKQTRNLPKGSFVGLAEDIGGTNDASAEDDYTRYYTTIPDAYLERILFAEAERMSGLVIDDADFASEREVVKNEIRMRVFGQAYGKLVQLYLPEVSYAHLPYARPTLGSAADLDAATIDDARAFHALYYRPDNAVLSIAGNYDPARLDRWIGRYFGPIARPTWPIPRVDAVEPERTAPTRHVVYEDGTPSPAVVASFPVPREADADTPALMVLNAALTAGDSSRLHQALVDRRVAQASASLLEQRQLGGSLAVYAILAGDVTAADGEAALKRELARLRDEPVPPPELERVKNQLLTGAIRTRETIDGKAAEIAKAAVVSGDPRATERRLVAIGAITAADVQRVAAKYLVDSRAAVIHYLPSDAKPAGASADTIEVPATVVQKALAPPPSVPVVTPADAQHRIALPGPGKAASVALKPVEQRLRNGLRVVVVERRGSPLVSLSVVAPAGSAGDPPGRAGLAALTAELMTKGTSTRTGAEIAREVETLGGSIGSNVGWDGASIGVTVRSGAVEPGLTVLSDVARNPRFAAADIDNARAQAIDAIDDLRQDPMKLARMVASRLAFGNAPYGSPRVGTVSALKAITADDVAQTYARAWRPSSATFVVVGDITPKAARRLAEQAFGDWREVEAFTPPPAPRVDPLPAPRVVVVDMPDAAEAAVVVTRAAIARTDRAYYAFLVANAALGGGGSSRLNSEIRYKRALTYDAGSALIEGRTAGSLVAATLTRHDAAAQVVGLIAAQMHGLAAAPLPAAELATRRQLVIGNYGRAVETTDGLAGLLGNLALQAVPLKELARYTSAIDRIDATAVQAVAARWFDPAGASVVVVGDAKQFVDELRKTYPSLEVVGAADVALDDARLR